MKQSHHCLAVLFLFSISLPLARAGNHVVGCGDNTFNQTNVPAGATNVMAIAAGGVHSLALKSDGTVVGWGRAPASTPPTGLSNVVAIAAGSGQSLALKSDGTLIAWGAPSTAATTNIPSGLSNIVAIACGDDHNLVLRADGTIYAWGANYSGQTNIPASVSNVVAIVAGNTGNLAIKNDGTTWGSRNFTNIIKVFSNVVAGALVAGGDSQGAVVLGDGTAVAWGYSGFGVLTNIPDVTAVCGRSGFNQAGAIWALCRNGTLKGFGSFYLGQTNVYQNLSNVLAVAIGYTHHLAIVGDGLPLPFAPLSEAAFSQGRFTVSQPTIRGLPYRLEYKSSLTDPGWQMLPPVPGDGNVHTLTDPNPADSQRIYRVHVGQ